jgi:hypothetical protein
MFIMAAHFAFASLSFTGITEKRDASTKYSLKNLNKYNTKSILSLSSLKSSLQQKPSITTINGQSGEVTTLLRFDNGNTTFIYPYKYKVKVPKFKTPTPASAQR